MALFFWQGKLESYLLIEGRRRFSEKLTFLPASPAPLMLQPVQEPCRHLGHLARAATKKIGVTPFSSFHKERALFNYLGCPLCALLQGSIVKSFRSNIKIAWPAYRIKGDVRLFE
jgi:hypothetical protein